MSSKKPTLLIDANEKRAKRHRGGDEREKEKEKKQKKKKKEKRKRERVRVE